MKKIVLAAYILLLSQLGWAAENHKPINVDDNEQDRISYQFAIYLIPDCGKDPITTARKHAQTLIPNFVLATSVSNPKKPSLSIDIINNAQTEYSPPSEQAVHYFGRGISIEEGKKLQKSNSAILLNFSYPLDYALIGMQEALSFTKQLAQTCKGLIWDESTREIFSPGAWHEKRIASWEEDGPNITDHTVIHAYKNTEFIRAISLGMRKFNLPDIVVNDFTWSNNNQMGNLINIIGQSLIEGRKIDAHMMLKVNLHEMRNKALKDSIISSLKKNSSGQTIIPLKPAKHEEGDPDNYLLEIDFGNQIGNGLQERQETFISQFFGSEDKITYIKHDEEIKAASAAAKKKLPQLKKDFNKGLKPGEYIYLKAPFKTPDNSNEWMWIEVIGWDKTIKGILQNDPFEIPTLRAGAEVYVTEDEIFDYIRNFPDGTTEGNETGKLIQAYEDSENGTE
ncbi:MAG: DUF2314 domain-containing protein [Cellvibrio sp.]|uniref:DUF2314 domain-containing protein n=1 Tax=Cellvibrio sp. TaxID=1965322 RepID=UPI00272385B8|nr:DUF2314 domain-containing protein [Cellvibrio sp.]